MIQRFSRITLFMIVSILAVLSCWSVVQAEESKDKTAIVVNVDNFDRVQTDFEYAGIIKLAGGINMVHSNRTPTPIDKQNVIRMNRDTLYSLGVINISKGATVTLPDVGKRYMSLMIINNDGYVNDVY